MNNKMKKICLDFFLILSTAIYIDAQSSHTLCFSYGCFDSGDTQLGITLDKDELCYMDFKNKTAVWDTRVPISAQPTFKYDFESLCKTVCNQDIHRWKPDKSVTRAKEVPETVLYPKNEVIKDEENTLICLSTNFFPPKIHIKWTKNNKEIAEEDSFIRTIPNYDGTFSVLSYLKFVPEQGDIYGCCVEHEALEEPLTRFWGIKIDEMSSAPEIFCGLGLSLGLLGIAAGTFLFVKAKQHHCTQN